MYAAPLLLLVVIAYRVLAAMAASPSLSWMQNFSPMAALVLCSAAFFPRSLAIALPLAGLLISDLLLNAHYGVGLISIAMLPQYLAFAIVAAVGWALRGRTSWGRMLGASLVCSLAFYLITNTGAWLAEPRYASSLAGWAQALTAGLPGYPPTWTFLRSTVLSDLLFTGLFLLCVAQSPARAGEPKKLVFA